MKRFFVLLLFTCAWCLEGSLALGQSSKPLRIGIIVDGPWERNNDMRDLLQNVIREVLGKEKAVDFPPGSFLVGDWTLAGVRALDSRLLADPEIDMVLGMGLISSQDLATRGPLP